MKVKTGDIRPCEDLPHRLVVIYDLAQKRFEENAQKRY